MSNHKTALAHYTGEFAKMLIEDAPAGSRIVVMTPERIDLAESTAELLDALALAEEMRYGETVDASDRRQAAQWIREMLAEAKGTP